MKFTHAGAIVLAASFALTGCNVSPISSFGSAANSRTAPLGTETKPSASLGEPIVLDEKGAKPGAALEGDFDNGKALKLMYGNFNPETKRAQWKPTRGDLDKFNFYSDIKAVYSRAYFAKAFQENGNTRYFVITRTAPAKEDCEDCVPVLGGAVFTKQGDEWKLDAQTKALTRTGLHGELSNGKLIKIGADRYGVAFHWKATNLGVTEEGELLIAETKSGLKEVFSMVTGGNNRKYCEENKLDADDPACWSYKSTIEYLPNANSGYNDIRITSTGNKQIEENEVAPMRETNRFYYTETGYRPYRQ